MPFVSSVTVVVLSIYVGNITDGCGGNVANVPVDGVFAVRHVASEIAKVPFQV